jgi:FixJ family two-component response regulator
MTADRPTVFLVDDDPGVLKALTLLLETSDYEVRAFSSPKDFLAQHDPSIPGCAIFDVAMPDQDGLALQQSLAQDKIIRPIIFITGFGNIPTSVQAMKAGAIDFLTKPISDKQLLDAVRHATALDGEDRRRRQELQSIDARLAKLTPREYEVLTHVIAGKLNKQIAYEIGTVLNTVKTHRSRAMEKLDAKSVAELVRIAEKAGVRPASGRR